MLWALLAQPLEQRVCAMQSSGCALRYIFLKDRALALQFLGISFVVGKEALGHIQAEQGPEEGGMLLLLAAASVIVLSALCGLKLDLSVSLLCLPAQRSGLCSCTYDPAIMTDLRV